MKKAFSLIELLVTCAIIAIMIGIVIGVYNNINSSAIAVAQQKDTAELNQVMGMLHMSGGNIAAITDPNQNITIMGGVANANEQAYAFNLLLHNNLTTNSKVQEGSVGGSMLPANEMIEPYSVADGKPRLVIINASTGRLGVQTPSLGTVLAGFIIVHQTPAPGQAFSNITLPGSQQLAAKNLWSNTSGPNNTNIGAVVSNPTNVGSKYANNNAYVWNEDPGVTTSPNPNPTTAPLINVAFVIAFSPSVDPNNQPSGTSMSYNFVDYTNHTTATQTTAPATPATIYAFAYNQDDPSAGLGPVSLAANVGGSSSGVITSSMPAGAAAASVAAFGSSLQSLGSAPGMLVTMPLNSVLPIPQWVDSGNNPVSSETFAIAADGTHGTGGVNGTITAAPIAAGAPPLSNTSITAGSGVSFTANPLDPSGVISVIPSITDPTNGVSSYLNAADTTLTFTDPLDGIDISLTGTNNDYLWNGSAAADDSDGDAPQ